MPLSEQERKKLDLIGRIAEVANGIARDDARWMKAIIDRLAGEPKVVRCKDCKRTRRSSRGNPNMRFCMMRGCAQNPNDFCSDGERRKEPDDG